MGKIVLHASMSLDGYTAGPNVDMEHPMGVGGMWLHEWLFADPIDPVDAVVSKAMYDRRRVGAVLMGRRHFDVGVDHWCPEGTFEMPCFVVTHRAAPPLEKGRTRFEFITGGMEEAVSRARAAACGLDINVIGADIARQLLVTGLIDEINVNVVPILLGGGASLFGGLEAAQVEFEQLGAAPSSTVTHIRYRVTVPPAV
jgi:dihydrofolate reductase